MTDSWGVGRIRTGCSCPPPPPRGLCRPKFQPPQSEGAGRGLVPLGDQETGEQTFCCPHPPPTEMGPDRKQAQHPPPPSMPSHPHCRPSHGDRGPSGSGRRATSMLGSGTRMVTQQVVLFFFFFFFLKTEFETARRKFSGGQPNIQRVTRIPRSQVRRWAGELTFRR